MPTTLPKKEVDPRTEHRFEEMKKVDRNHAKTLRHNQNQESTRTFPTQQDFKIKMKSLLQEYHKILQPTLDNCTRDTTLAEIKERSYLKLLNPIDSYNKCIKSAYDYHDMFKCQNELSSFMENEGLEFAREMAREY